MVDHPSIARIGKPPDHFNLAAYVLAAGAKTPAKVALRVIGSNSQQTWTFAALSHAVKGTAQGLVALGLTEGDRILMRLGNTPDFPIVFLGAIYAGLVPIPTSAQLTAPEVSAIAAETDPKLVVFAQNVTRPVQSIRAVSSAELLTTSATQNLPAVRGDPNRPAYIVYTSGTSGKPRAVVHAHRAIWARRMMWEGWYGLRSDDVMLHAGAFNWTYTLGTGLMDPWAIGATALIPADGTPGDQLPALITAYKASIFAAAPGVYRRLLRSHFPECPSLRHGLSAGEKLPATIAKAWEDATNTPVLWPAEPVAAFAGAS